MNRCAKKHEESSQKNGEWSEKPEKWHSTPLERNGEPVGKSRIIGKGVGESDNGAHMLSAFERIWKRMSQKKWQKQQQKADCQNCYRIFIHM